MIARLRGILAEKSKERIIVDVQGVGYGLLAPDTVLASLPDVGQETTLQVYTHVREDQLQLFGFSSQLEKDCFEILMSANGVGPKLALGILSVLRAERVMEAVISGDKDSLVSIPGVGKKTAERIIIEIKEKCERRLMAERTGSEKLSGAQKRALLEKVSSYSGDVVWAADLEEALRTLGYKDQELRQHMKEVLAKADSFKDLQEALKYSLQNLAAFSKQTLRGNA